MRILTSLILVLLLTSVQLIAQISSGGAPLSFSIALDGEVPTLEMPAIDVRAYLAEDEADGWDKAARFGAPHDVAINLNNSGVWTELRDGRLWRCRIRSQGAFSLNLQLDKYHLPPGARLFIYNDDRSHVIGAFTDRNNKPDGRLGIQPVQGDAITLEYFESSSHAGEGEISIWRVVHAYRNMFHHGALDEYGDAAECAVNINCPEGADWQDEKRGVAMILVDGIRWCSGTLINNTRNDGTPYFHTAQHCTEGTEISSWVFLFNYESPGCDNVDGPLNQSASSGTLLFTNWATDIALIEIAEPIPLEYNPYFNGWNAIDVAPTSSVCISHPACDIKKIGVDNDPAESSSFPGTPEDSHWNVVQWDAGHAEHGSSGSPLFDQNHLIVGQCHGGDGWCNDVEFHNVTYGKLAWSFTAGASEWLDPDNSGVQTLAGYDPNIAGRVLGVVRDSLTHEPLAGVRVRVVGGTRLATTNASGAYNLPLVDGVFDLDYSKWGYFAHQELGVTITEGDTVVRDIDLNPAIVLTLLDEDFEGAVNGWTHGPTGGTWGDQWHLSTESAHTASHSYKCGDTGTGDYAPLLDARLTSPLISSLPPDALLSFWMKIQSETSGAYPDSAYDGGILELQIGNEFIQVTPDRGYSHVFRYMSGVGNPATGPMPGTNCIASFTPTDWTQYTVDLSDYEGESFHLNFRFGSDAITSVEGWYIDDVLVQGIVDEPPAVTGLVIWRDGNDIMLSWNDNATPYYRIFSSSDSEPPFPTWEGTTDQNSFRIINGISSNRQFYYVVASRTE
jgi:hypothetical protein